MSIEFIIILAIFVIMSIAGFLSMGIDKRKAQKGKWRIPEATLFGIAILLGGVGSTAGMYFFRHKTKHWYFKIFMPLLGIIDIAVIVVSAIYLL